MKRSPKAKSKVFDITETEDKVRQPPKLDRMTQLLKELRNIRKSIHSIEVSKKNSAKSEEILNTQFSALKDEIKEALFSVDDELNNHEIILKINESEEKM